MAAEHKPGWRPDLEHNVYGKTEVYTPDESKHVRHYLPIDIDELERQRRAQLGFEPTSLEDLRAEHEAKLREAEKEEDTSGDS